MGKETKNFIICIVGWVCFITFTFYIGTRCYLSINQSVDYIKDSLSNSISFFSALSTIGASIIAARLVSDWKEPLLFNKKTDFFVVAGKYNETMSLLIEDTYNLIGTTSEEYLSELDLLQDKFLTTYQNFLFEYKQINKILEIKTPPMSNMLHPIQKIRSTFYESRKLVKQYKNKNNCPEYIQNINHFENMIDETRNNLNNLLDCYLLNDFNEIKKSILKYY